MPYPDAKYPPEYRPEKQEPMACPTCGTPGAIWSKLEEMHEDTRRAVSRAFDDYAGMIPAGVRKSYPPAPKDP
jgi:hypothetical protein